MSALNLQLCEVILQALIAAKLGWTTKSSLLYLITFRKTKFAPAVSRPPRTAAVALSMTQRNAVWNCLSPGDAGGPIAAGDGKIHLMAEGLTLGSMAMPQAAPTATVRSVKQPRTTT